MRHRGRGFSHAFTGACGGPTSRKKIDGRLTRFFSEALGEFLSQPHRQNIHFSVHKKKKKELAACFWVCFFWVCFFSTVFGQIGPKVTHQKSVKTSKKKKSVRRIFRQMPSHAKAADKIGKVLSLGNSS
jgi:hypothetical protein